MEYGSMLPDPPHGDWQYNYTGLVLRLGKKYAELKQIYNLPIHHVASIRNVHIRIDSILLLEK